MKALNQKNEFYRNILMNHYIERKNVAKYWNFPMKLLNLNEKKTSCSRINNGTWYCC
ncbi:hypothetical protein NT05LI_2038 [Listeria ivanovii FSL F6-596]|nr:hypothetical protein NT05LI_2038 [Listeria ivanovii FSL F6-596]